MNVMNHLFDGKGSIDGITIIDTKGEILFTAKFNTKLNSGRFENYEVVGKKLLDIYENLSEETSSMYRAMMYGVPIYTAEQPLNAVGRTSIKITSLSTPIKARGKIVGAIDLSCSEEIDIDNDGDDVVKVCDEVLKAMSQMSGFQMESGEAHYTLDDIITGNHKMIEMKELMIKAANCNLPVMIYGETGTGKELVAHAIHNLSERAKKPFVVQNCAAIPDNLLESILFGTSKGAFTGALDNTGLFELANGGTLFLDEINSMSIGLQAKLLRVLQEGMFRKVGALNVKHVDVRILTATNEDPMKLLKQGIIRQDIYYRLSVFNVDIPPLRNRKDDVPLLINYFVSKYNKKFGKNITYVSKKVITNLMRYDWPGNVRELESLIAYGISVVDEDTSKLECKNIEKKFELMTEFSKIKEKELAEEVTNTKRPLTELVSNYERNLIEKVLQETESNITAAAKILNLPRQTLSRKIKEYNLL